MSGAENLPHKSAQSHMTSDMLGLVVKGKHTHSPHAIHVYVHVFIVISIKSATVLVRTLQYPSPVSTRVRRVHRIVDSRGPGLVDMNMPIY